MPHPFLVSIALSLGLGLCAPVERVVDGDTIRVRIGETEEVVRYIGVDTPETVDPRRPVEAYGREAAEKNRELVAGRVVRLYFDVQRRDRYGRLLAYVCTGAVFVNAELLRQGYAQLMTVPPNVRFVELFVRRQQEAREAGRGLWGAPPPAVTGTFEREGSRP